VLSSLEILTNGSINKRAFIWPRNWTTPFETKMSAKGQPERHHQRGYRRDSQNKKSDRMVSARKVAGC
jgi:hypothetical protein